MPYSERQKEYTMRYLKERLDEIKFRIPKGQKDFLRAYAESNDEKLTPFILRAIHETIYHDMNAKDSAAVMTILSDGLPDGWEQGKTEKERQKIIVETVFAGLLEMHQKDSVEK